METNKRWSKKERELLLYLLNRNTPTSEIAKELGRSEASIVRKMEDLGYYKY